MAAQNHGVPLVAGETAHFWHISQEAYLLIRQLYNLSPNHEQEDIVHHVWNAILRVYFAASATTPIGPRWSVLLEQHRGPQNNLPMHRPDVLVVSLQYQPFIGGPFRKRDYIWVECKPPSHDRPSGWKNVINEAATRLNDAHPTRTLFVIAAVGRRMMLFMWDPSNSVPTPQLTIQSATSPNVNWHLDTRLKGHWGSWVDRTTGRIDLNEALELDCFTRETVNGQSVLKRRTDIALIEQMLVSIRNMGLDETNPSY